MNLDPPAAKKSGPPTTTDNDPLAGKRELTDRPPDDWGTRYGLQNQNPGPFVHTNRSWITPSFPSFDRRATNNPRHFPNHFTDHESLLADGVPAPVDSEADRLFTSERIQQRNFAGLRTWEAALLQDVKAYQSGNELANGCMISKRLAVREDGWFPVFRKHRWIDYNVKVSESRIDLPRKNGGRDAIWSVDNPAVWEELRPCIELANRLLCMATRGPWLSSLLDSSAHETSHGSCYLMDWDTGKVGRIGSSIRRFVDIDPSRRLSPAAVSDLLRTTDHLISWSFFGGSDEKSTPEAFRGQSPCIVDCQAIEQSGKSQMTISLDVSLLKPLMSWNLNVTDKAVVQHTIGVNLLLAYVDALARSRGLHFLEEEKKLNPDLQHPRQYQMFFGDEITADHKASFANSLFGAKLEFPLYQSPAGKGDRAGFQVITTARDFPLEEDVLKQLFATGEVPAPSWYTHLDPHKAHRHTSYPIPNIWQASMMNEDFWQVQVAKFGVRALQVPKDIQTENVLHPAWSMKSSLPIKTSFGGRSERHNVRFKDHEGNKVKVLSTARPLTGQADTGAAARLGRQLDDRRVLWDKMRRDWYPDMHADWEELPHANIDFREELRLLTEEYFVRRSDFDEFRAHEIARRWIAMGTFATDKDNIPDTFRRHALMCRAAGLAVMAALPARKAEKRCLRTGSVDMRAGAETWRLSREARASKVPIKPFETWWADDPAPEFVLPTRHEFNPANKVADVRIAMLHEAKRALKEYDIEEGATTAVSRPLRAQIRHCLHILEDYTVIEILSSRAEGQTWAEDEIPTKGPERWLEMFFGLAEYTYSKGPAPPPQVQAKNLIFSKEALEELRNKEPNPGRLEQRPQRPLQVNWWSVGQVAEQNSMANLWVLEWFGRDFWVYNVTPCILRLRWNKADMERHIQYTEHGRVLKRSLGTTFGKEYAGFAKWKGRLKRWYRESDMALMGPKDRKARVAIGEHIYSSSEASRVRWGPDVDQDAARAITRAVSRSKPGTLATLQNHRLRRHSRTVQKALKRYRVGRIRRREFPGSEGALYTVEELSWFLSERTGMYTAVNGTVYDLTDFFKWHPGGRTVLREHAVGKDATDVFNNWHAAGLEESICHLAIGRIVTQHDGDTYAHDEFLINNYVYKLGIAEGEELDDSNYLHRLYKASSWFRGAAAHEFVRNGNEAALRLARHRELIVAKKPVVGELPMVSIADVSKCNNGFTGNYSTLRAMAWIAVGAGTYSKGHVYDITSILNDPFQESNNPGLLMDCGGRTNNVAISRWLRENHRGRIVATFGPVERAFVQAEKMWRQKDPGSVLHRAEINKGLVKTPVERQEDAGCTERAQVRERSPDVEIADPDVTLPPSEKNAWAPTCHPPRNHWDEQERLDVCEEELRQQGHLRAAAREQLKRTYPQTPLVQVRPLAKGEKPPLGRHPIGTDRDKRKNLPPLPETWPYGVSSMFKDKFTPEMMRLAAAYVADNTLPASGGTSKPQLDEGETSEEMTHLLYNRIAPILRTYAGKSEDSDFGDPGSISEGEDEWIAGLKRLGTLFDESFLHEFRGQVAGDAALEGLEQRVNKRKREAEADGRELKKPRLLGTPERRKSVAFALPIVAGEADARWSLSCSGSEESDEAGSGGSIDESDEGEESVSSEHESASFTEEDESKNEDEENVSPTKIEESDEEEEEEQEVEEEDVEEGSVSSTEESEGGDEYDGSSSTAETNDDDDKTSGDYTEDQDEQGEETWESVEREIEDHLFGRPDSFTGDAQGDEHEEAESDRPTERFPEDEDEEGREWAFWRGDEAVAAANAAEDGAENWYAPEAQPAAPQHRDTNPEPRAEEQTHSDESSREPRLPATTGSATGGHGRRPTREETAATIRERLPHLLEVERAVAEQAERARMQTLSTELSLEPRGYRVWWPGVPWEMQPSDFSLELREEEAEERARKGPLAAARDEHGRRI